MTDQELKNILTMRVISDPAALAEMEMFFAEHSNVNESNFQSLQDAWRESERGKKANAMIAELVNADKDSKIQHGLTTIEKGAFSYVNKTRGKCLGTYVVYDNITRLRGLVTEKGEEVLPCIFDSISVKLDGFIEVMFCGSDYDFIFSAGEYEPAENMFCYGENSAYMATHCKRNSSPKFQQLIGLLKKNHTKE